MATTFRRDGDKLIMAFGVNEVFSNTCMFKTHREYISHVFKQHGFEITKWNWDKDPETGSWVKHADGIEFMSVDRLVDIAMEVHATIGKNVREIRDEPTGNIIQG